MAKWIGHLKVAYEIEAENREAARSIMDSIARSTERTGITGLSSGEGTAKLKKATVPAVVSGG